MSGDAAYSLFSGMSGGMERTHALAAEGDLFFLPSAFGFPREGRIERGEQSERFFRTLDPRIVETSLCHVFS